MILRLREKQTIPVSRENKRALRHSINYRIFCITGVEADRLSRELIRYSRSLEDLMSSQSGIQISNSTWLQILSRQTMLGSDKNLSSYLLERTFPDSHLKASDVSQLFFYTLIVV